MSGNGGLQYEVHVECLSDAARLRYLEVLKRGMVDAGLVKRPSEMDLALRDADAAELGRIADWQKEWAVLRFAVVAGYREFVAGVDRGELLARKEQFCRLYNERVLVFSEEVRVVVKSVSVSTLDRWERLMAEHQGDSFALAPGYGKRRGQQKVNDDEGSLLVQCALVPGKPIKMAIADFKRLLLVRGGVPSASDATYARFLDQFRRNHFDQWTFAREGDKALNDKVLPYLERDRGLVGVGELLVSDGHKFNFDIVDPVDGKAKRMMLVMVYDFLSGMPVGWEISRTENTGSIAMAYFRSMKALGFVPRRFYLDNGRAYRGNYFTKVNNDSVSLSGVFERLKRYGYDKTMFARPYHGQSKPIERFFATVDGQFSRRMETYRGNCIENKVPRLLRNEKVHQAQHEALTDGFVPSVLDVHLRMVEWIEEYATAPTSKSHGLKGARPIDVFNESLERVRAESDFASRCVSEDQIRFLMMDARRPKIDRNGMRLFGNRYWSEELYGLRDRALVVRYDVLDQNRVWVFDEAGCELICVAEKAVFSGVHPAAVAEGDVARVKALLEVQSGFRKESVSNVKQLFRSQVADVQRALPPVSVPEPEPVAVKQAVGAGSVSAEDEEWYRRAMAGSLREAEEAREREAREMEKYSIFRR